MNGIFLTIKKLIANIVEFHILVYLVGRKMSDPLLIVTEYLDSSANLNERLERIKDLRHCLNFEKRLAELTEEESEAMVMAGEGHLTDQQRLMLDSCVTEKEKDRLIAGFARQQYFIQCACASYLNGESDLKPVDSKVRAEQMWNILRS
jgi:hypothetical protein